MRQHLPAGVAGLLMEDEALRASILLPTDPAEPTRRGDRTRYRDLLRAIEQQAAADGFDAKVVARVLRPAYDLLEDPPFWAHPGHGLAVYSAPQHLATFRLPYPVAERAALGVHALITPLVPLIAEDRAFFILALSRGAVRLLRGARDGVDEVALPAAVPPDLDALLAGDVYETEHRYVAGPPGARGRPGAIFYGQGDAGTARIAQDRAYCDRIDRGLRDVAGFGEAPLVLAGDEALLATYRQVTTHPQVLAADLAGNPEHLGAADLHARAWPLVAAQLRAERERASDRFRALLGTGLASDEPAEILRAAHGGRIDTLLLRPDEAIWGTFDPATGGLRAHAARQPGDEDLVNLATVQTLRHEGLVQALDRARIPGQGPLAAIFRY